MREVTEVYTVYTYDEMDEDQQEKVLAKYGDINVDYSWWEGDYHLGLTSKEHQERRKVDETGCIVVFDNDGDAWLTLGGCGMDMTPHRCHAWLELGYTWLPLEWIENLVGNSTYIEACKPPEVAERIRLAIDDTLNTAKGRIKCLIEQNSRHLMIGAESE